jgi:UDPglucose--hexose-1-phosphate uridylyltransferase
MSEMRQDPTTKEWVIIAAERSRRPDEFRQQSKRERKSYSVTCPFCLGNEHFTPLETFAIRDSGSPNTPGWRIRVVPNKFAALSPQVIPRRSDDGLLFRGMEGFGYHEVIIETPHHDRDLPLMSEDEILNILETYRHRYKLLREDERVKLIVIFRNYGERAGTSLLHPHSQLVAVPVIPFHTRQKYEEATRHYDDTGRCLYCDLRNAEREYGKRVVLETGHWLVFHPFASQAPFETWIVPKRHASCFASMTNAELPELASVLRRILHGLHTLLNDPDFNMIIHTAPVEDENTPYFVWHIEIYPRLTTPAGFELGSGIFINVAAPEETAHLLREIVAAS